MKNAFQNKKNDYLVLKIFIFSFLALSIILFGVGSFFDMEINSWFAKGMDVYFIKIIVWIYEEAGMTQSFIFIFLFIAVILEVTFISSSKSLKWKIVLIIYYVGWLVFWLTFNITQIIAAPLRDDGFGPGVNGWFLDNQKIRQYILVSLFIIETIGFGGVFYFLRFKFSNRADLLQNGYRVDAIKALTIYIVSSLVVWIMKPTFGRPYFYSVDFANIFYSDRLQPEWRDYWVQTGHKIKSWGYINKETGLVESVPYKEWWQINNFFGNIKDIFKPLGSQKPGWWNMDFPSGHMNSCFAIVFAGYFFIGEKKNRKITGWKWIFLIGWFVHINLMQYTQIISRTHWITDTSFTISMTLILFIFNGLVIDKIINKYNTKNNRNFR
ncbi:hypothetical protein MENTO_v1c00540 [Mesoplasma entomophilum]|uniref:phosphatase PAP2 family protein n=1 Tax=Mesoplasma entomophilum TaxID=2149 RepID=UPI000CA10293|nr:phosphatase PAP2 family protein [Mesoplasma entomophilum]ATZ19163.1 hypothetical protein MENTO_v1c00540 [Mesoplasma entomophilum]